MSNYTATYSVEDNKLRLYCSERLDAETFERVKSAGYKWAPKQELFVAPRWTPAREDLAVEMAGEIEPEGSTLADRAQVKAARLDQIAANKAKAANAFRAASDAITSGIPSGQPILAGHHSERRARKDADRIERNERNALKAHQAVEYWQWRAEGVEHFANMKNSDRTRSSRIQTLLKELRDHQRAKNEAEKRLKVWTACDTREKAALAIKLAYHNGHVQGVDLRLEYGTHAGVESGEIDALEVRNNCLRRADLGVNGPLRARWINHILGRLGYEREALGPVARFEGKLTPVILQTFARTHGAEKPKATATDCDSFDLTSAVTLPLHIAETSSTAKTADEWRDLMQSAGYEVPAKKAGPPPVLNFKADKIEGYNHHQHRVKTFPQIEMTKAEYMAIHSDSRWLEHGNGGAYRFRVAPDPTFKGAYYMCPRVAVFLTDSKAHPAPNQDAA